MGADKCDTAAALVFIVGLLAGTGCIICAKALFEVQSIGLSGHLEDFKPPVFQSWVMFFGMLFALPMYGFSELFRKFKARTDPELRKKIDAEPVVTWYTLIYLGIPAVFVRCRQHNPMQPR